ncbi:MAG: hypothetical protein EXR72_18195 [Myxococcales bacterium]|nr:hypothetical protein [Myxococcales bacterium]
MKTRSVALALGGLAIGLCGGGIFVGRATAEAPAWSPPVGGRCQYKCVTGLPSRIFKPETLAALNAEGGQGWRLIDGLSGQNYLSSGDQYCFERRY